MKSIDRRSLLKVATAAPFVLMAREFASAATQPKPGKAVYVAAGADVTGSPHNNPWVESQLDFKVLTKDSLGSLFLMEQRNLRVGGPRKHIHHDEDEWFYLMEGEKLVVEVGEERITLKPGDSLLAPRQVPHAFAYIGKTPGRMLVGFTPANRMQAFFEANAKLPRPLPPNEVRAYGIEVVGPPLDVTKL